jgi:hypothetical protein
MVTAQHRPNRSKRESTLEVIHWIKKSEIQHSGFRFDIPVGERRFLGVKRHYRKPETSRLEAPIFEELRQRARIQDALHVDDDCFLALPEQFDNVLLPHL